jgi:hypothetical protein
LLLFELPDPLGGGEELLPLPTGGGAEFTVSLP